MKFGNSVKATLIAAIVVVAGLAFIAPAYSYSSTVTTNGTVAPEYITINILDGESAAPSMTFDAVNWSVGRSETPDSFDILPKDGKVYTIKAQSNKGADAYLYGYFTGAGKGIDTITITLDMGGTPTEMVLYRNAAVNQVTLGNTSSDINEWSVPISSYTVNCFEGLQVASGNTVPVSENGAAPSATTLASLFSIDGMTFYFFISWDSLI